MNWYRVSTGNVRWRQPNVMTSLCKRGVASISWIAIAILVVIVLLSLAAEKAQPLILLACIGAGMLAGDKVAQLAHEFLGVLTDRWRERRPSAYCRRHIAGPRIRLKGTVLGGILAAGLWFAFHPAPSNWLSANAPIIATASVPRGSDSNP